MIDAFLFPSFLVLIHPGQIFITLSQNSFLEELVVQGWTGET